MVILSLLQGKDSTISDTLIKGATEVLVGVDELLITNPRHEFTSSPALLLKKLVYAH
jgi:hypothetical protein